ncbi:MAG TPA: copper chaperone PCu(A)C [Trebonia sp.]|nr:copper chaperone PCu(A)C [Trebonia sp.]
MSLPSNYEEAFAVIRASFGKTAARSTLIGGLALLAIPAVAGCEAGYNAPTLEFHSASAGAHTVVNGIAINDAFVLGAPSGSVVPTGSSASMFLGLFNNGTAADKLVAAAAPGTASSVTIKGGSVTIPAGGAADLSGPEPVVVLKGLTKSLTGGQAVKIVLQFASAGQVKFNVPVMPRSFYYSTYSPPAAPATGKAKASASPLPTPTATSTPTAKTPVGTP